jgi:homocysteine S-methyltransferase
MDKFLDRLSQGVILGDGAVGTQLYERGIYVNRNFDELNLTDPHLVEAVHKDYLGAGAQLLETNTFGANPYKLGKHGLSEKCYEINKAGAELARRSAEGNSDIFVAASIGPLGSLVAPLGKIPQEEALAAFKVQLEGLIAGGVDLFILETFVDMVEIRLAIQAVRELSSLSIVALMTVGHDGKTVYGMTVEEVTAELDREPIQVIGLNCSTGPQTILEGIERMRNKTQKPLAAFPNAGEPQVVDGRILYLSTPDYFATYTRRLIHCGVRLTGGCCGTTPKHIRSMSAAIRSLKPGISLKKKQVSVEPAPTIQEVSKTSKSSAGERAPSYLAQLLQEDSFPVSVELHPPRSGNVQRMLEQVRQLQTAGIDVVNIPDGPRASARMSSMALAHIIMQETGMDAILHYTCRDRNILGIQSDLLGGEALGLRNILCVTGDPPKLGDYPMATAVFDVDAIGLLKIARNLNNSLDLAGNPIKHPTSFFLGAGFNPGAIDLDLEIDRLHQKIESGARYILTQPVFDLEKLLIALAKAGKVSVPIMVGILPLASYRNAEFFHNEVPGMEVPDNIRERMREASEKGKAHAFAAGVTIAQESLSNAEPYVQGAYFMPPFGKVELAIEAASILSRKRLSLAGKRANRHPIQRRA